MNTESKKLRIDRIEEGIIVAFSDDGKKYTLRENEFKIHESDIIDALISQDGEIISASVLKEETENKKSSLFSRLKKLFKK